MPVRFASSDNVQIAYDTVGDGPIDIVYVQGYVSHLDVMWELPAYRSFCERIGEFARFIRFDKRGMGMSDRVPGATTLETRMDDIRAVMDAIGSERAVLIGCLLLVLVVELLNSAIEAAIDRHGDEMHELSGRAKDMGSAAVFISLLIVIIVWGLIAADRFID